MLGILSKYSCLISSFSLESGFQQHKSYIHALLTHRACTEQVSSSVSGGSRAGHISGCHRPAAARERLCRLLLVHFPSRVEKNIGFAQAKRAGTGLGWGGGFAGAPPPCSDCRDGVLPFASVDLGYEHSPAHPSALRAQVPCLWPWRDLGSPSSPWPICTTSFGKGFNPPSATRLLNPPVLMLTGCGGASGPEQGCAHLTGTSGMMALSWKVHGGVLRGVWHGSESGSGFFL